MIANKKLNKPFTLHLQNTQGKWLLDETEGTFFGPNGIEIPGRVELQSEMTGQMVGQILSTGNCPLTDLSESIKLHRIFLTTTLIINNIKSLSSSNIPIT